MNDSQTPLMSADNPELFEAVYSDLAGALFLNIQSLADTLGFEYLLTDWEDGLICFTANGYTVEIGVTLGELGEVTDVILRSNGVEADPISYEWRSENDKLYLSPAFLWPAMNAEFSWEPETRRMEIHF
jgi:hypothetical protein